MSTNKENAIWKEAVEAETSTFKQNKGRRKAPFFKVLQGMPIAVDAFRYGRIPGVTAYFLTYGSSFPRLLIYPSETIDTAAMLILTIIPACHRSGQMVRYTVPVMSRPHPHEKQNTDPSRTQRKLRI